VGAYEVHTIALLAICLAIVRSNRVAIATKQYIYQHQYNAASNFCSCIFDADALVCASACHVAKCSAFATFSSAWALATMLNFRWCLTSVWAKSRRI